MFCSCRLRHPHFPSLAFLVFPDNSTCTNQHGPAHISYGAVFVTPHRVPLSSLPAMKAQQSSKNDSPSAKRAIRRCFGPHSYLLSLALSNSTRLPGGTISGRTPQTLAPSWNNPHLIYLSLSIKIRRMSG